MSSSEPAEMALLLAKRELRKQMKIVLSGISHDSIVKQTHTVLNGLFSLPEYHTARSISVFLSMPSGEISTAEIVNCAFREQKKIFIPYTYKLTTPREFWPVSVMDMVQLHSIEDYQTLEPDKWGIPSPSRESINERRNCFGRIGKSDDQKADESTEDGLDIVIMPGLAFDRHLQRLGHGKGYYDFFLQRYLWHTQKTHRKMPFLVALALNEQVLSPEEYIPSDVTDYKLDALITGKGEIVRARHAPGPQNDVR